jgi:hypothetical protein
MNAGFCTGCVGGDGAFGDGSIGFKSGTGMSRAACGRGVGTGTSPADAGPKANTIEVAITSGKRINADIPDKGSQHDGDPFARLLSTN